MNAPVSDCVTRLEYQGRDIYLVGTAHVSQRSVADVARVIEEVRPDTVCVELDAARHQALVDPKRWRSLDIFQVIRERRIFFMLTSLVLSSYQRRIGAKLGVRPGAEMIAAIEHAERVGARLVLADRDIQATLKRTWAALSFWDSVQLFGMLVGSLFAKGEITAEQVEALKDRDNISELVKEFAEVMPRLQRPLIDERDRYLMSAIREAPGQRVVAVVGAGHVDGMIRYLHAEVDRAALCEIPPPGLGSRLARWILPLVVIGALGRGYAERGVLGIVPPLGGWVIANGAFSAAVVLLLRGHILTALATGTAAPILGLVPGASTGALAAYVEAALRRPTVEDCGALGEIASRQDWFANRFTRVLLVAFAASVGAGLGSFFGVIWVIVTH